MAFEGLARALNIGIERAQMLQQQAMERRLREMELAMRAPQPQQPVDILSLLPPEIRAQYAGQQSLEVPPNVAPTLVSGLLSYYRPQAEPRQEPMIDLRMLADWMTSGGDLSAVAERYPGAQIPASALPSFTMAPARAVEPTRIEAQARLAEARARDVELASQLREEFERPERQARLNQMYLDAARTRLQMQLDEEMLRRQRELTDPLVARAIAEAQAAQQDVQLTDATMQAAIDRYNQELENLRLQGMLTEQQLALEREMAPIKIREAQEALRGRELENRRRELEAQLLEEFGRAERAVSLEGARLRNVATQLGIALDEAQLERFTRLTDPVVAKTVAEAMAAELDVMMTQETFDTAVQRVNAELERLLTENKISQQEYDLAVQLAPYRVQEAQERLLNLQYEAEAQRLENEFAMSSYNARLQQLQLGLEMNRIQLQQAQVEVEAARHRLALARRLDPVQVQQAETELQLAQERLRQLQIQNQQFEEQQRVLGTLNPQDRNFAFDWYQQEIKPFQGRGVWIPSFGDFMANLMSDNPMDWNQYVMLYDREMREILGPAPSDQKAYEWLKPEWQSAYRAAVDAYYRQFPEFMRDIGRVPAFPQIEAWYAWINSPEIQALDPLSNEYRDALNQFVEWWNTRGPSGVPTGATTAEGEQTTSRQEGFFTRLRRRMTFNAESEADTILQTLGEGAIEEIESNRDVFRAAGYSDEQLDEILRAMRQRAQAPDADTSQLPWWDPRRYAVADAIAQEIGAILNFPGDFFLAPFGGRVSRDPDVAEENVSRGLLSLNILGILLGMRAAGGRPPTTGSTPPTGGVPATRPGPTGTFRGPITEPAFGELPPGAAQLGGAGSAVATQFGDDVLEFLARRLLAQNNGDINTTIGMITQRQNLLNSMGVNVQRLIQFVQGAL